MPAFTRLRRLTGTTTTETPGAETPGAGIPGAGTPGAETPPAEAPAAGTPATRAAHTATAEGEPPGSGTAGTEPAETAGAAGAAETAGALAGESSAAGAPAPDGGTGDLGVPDDGPAPAAADPADAAPADSGSADADPAGAGRPEPTGQPGASGPAGPSGPRAGHGSLGGIALTVLCALLVTAALLLPNAFAALRPDRFLRLPGELVIGAMVLLLLPRRAHTPFALSAGLALGALTVLNVLDMGFREYLGRAFDPVLDWALLDDAKAYTEDTMGDAATLAATAGAIAATVAVFVVLALATVRLSRAVERNRSPVALGALAAGTVWVVCGALGVQFGRVPFAADRAVQAGLIEARRVQATLRDEAEFAKEARADSFGGTPPAELVPDLRGKDMIFAFIESYGRSAIDDPAIAPGVNGTLDARTRDLERAGFHARSGWLTSATYGGSSWLGHSTFLSGLWIDNQQRYRTVSTGDHLTLTRAFRETGAWRTVGIVPGVQKGWPEAEFFGLDHVYDSSRLGYRGPKFSWSTMPDQFALEAFQRLEHGREHDKPLMAEVILTSSHQPWAPLPRTVGWDELGDGRIFDGIQKAGVDPEDIITSSARSKEEYGKSVQYSVNSLTGWLERYGGDDTVLVFLGDHQPIARVSGERASRDVPVTIVAKDPEVLAAVDDWHWTEGLRPDDSAPVWPMSDFRDRFLTAYGSVPHPTTG